MLLTIQEQFENLFTSDDIELYMDIGECLESLGYTILGPSITEVMMLGISEYAKQQEIKELHHETLVYTLSTYGVKINPEVTNTATLFKLLLLIKRIEENENSEDIVNICLSGDDGLDTFISLSNYLAELDWLIIQQTVSEVSSLFIERVIEHHDESEEVNENSVIQQYVTRVQAHLNNTEESLIEDYIEFYSDTRNYGYDFSSLIALRNEELISYNDDKLIATLKLFAMGSNLQDDEIYEQCDKWINANIDSGTRVYNLTSKL